MRLTVLDDQLGNRVLPSHLCYGKLASEQLTRPLQHPRRLQCVQFGPCVRAHGYDSADGPAVIHHGCARQRALWMTAQRVGDGAVIWYPEAPPQRHLE